MPELTRRDGLVTAAATMATATLPAVEPNQGGAVWRATQAPVAHGARPRWLSPQRHGGRLARGWGSGLGI